MIGLFTGRCEASKGTSQGFRAAGAAPRQPQEHNYENQGGGAFLSQAPAAILGKCWRKRYQLGTDREHQKQEGKDR